MISRQPGSRVGHNYSTKLRCPETTFVGHSLGFSGFHPPPDGKKRSRGPSPGHGTRSIMGGGAMCISGLHRKVLKPTFPLTLMRARIQRARMNMTLALQLMLWTAMKTLQWLKVSPSLHRHPSLLQPRRLWRRIVPTRMEPSLHSLRHA